MCAAIKNLSLLKRFNFSYDDSLTLYDGDSNAAPFIREYCGKSIPPSHTSSTNEIFLHFESDGDDHNNKGFKLEYHPYSKLR